MHTRTLGAVKSCLTGLLSRDSFSRGAGSTGSFTCAQAVRHPTGLEHFLRTVFAFRGFPCPRPGALRVPARSPTFCSPTSSSPPSLRTPCPFIIKPCEGLTLGNGHSLPSSTLFYLPCPLHFSLFKHNLCHCKKMRKHREGKKNMKVTRNFTPLEMIISDILGT